MTMADETRPHPYVRRRDPVLGEWCVTCGRYAWDELHTRPPVLAAEQPEGSDR
jgi:hypothetical protein